MIHVTIFRGGEKIATAECELEDGPFTAVTLIHDDMNGVWRGRDYRAVFETSVFVVASYKSCLEALT